MKASATLRIGSLLLVSCLAVIGRETTPHYKFSAGQTNAFAVEISVRSETGNEVTAGNVILVTREVTTNSVKLSCQGYLRPEVRRTPQRNPGFYSGYYPGGMMQKLNIFPNDCEIELDLQGREIRDGGDYVLAVPLGKLVQSIFEPLPAKSGNEKTSDTAVVLDDPFWLGPAENFMNIRLQNGQPFWMRFNMGYPQQTPATLTVARQASTHTTNSPADTLEWHKQATLESLTWSGTEPRLAATCESDFVFDRDAGLMSRIETQGDVTSQTETTSRKAKVTFKSRLLTGDELAAALAPPPPPAPPHKLSGPDLDKITADLKSPDLETRRAAVRQLNGVDVANPPDEFVGLVAAMATDSDSFVQMTAANFLTSHATTNEIPVLLKLLKDSNWPSRQAAAKALGRLKDDRAIQPLADLIARGGNMYGPDASAALISFGAPAENAVIALLNERNADTQRLACTILQQIGTAASLDPLQKLVGDSEESTSQAAVEAIRAIKERQ